VALFAGTVAVAAVMHLRARVWTSRRSPSRRRATARSTVASPRFRRSHKRSSRARAPWPRPQLLSGGARRPHARRPGRRGADALGGRSPTRRPSRQAIPYLRRLLRDHPGDARAPLAAFTLGRILLAELGQPTEAADAFALARRLAPRGPMASHALAREVEAAARGGDAAGPGGWRRRTSPTTLPAPSSRP
jgi:hypothetical protein